MDPNNSVIKRFWCIGSTGLAALNTLHVLYKVLLLLDIAQMTSKIHVYDYFLLLIKVILQGPVVQSIISLTSSLVIKLID